VKKGFEKSIPPAIDFSKKNADMVKLSKSGFSGFRNLPTPKESGVLRTGRQVYRICLSILFYLLPS